MAGLKKGLRKGLSKGLSKGLRWAAGGGLFLGTLPATIGELSGWTGTSSWTLLHNLKDATVGPTAVNSVSDGASLNLIQFPTSGAVDSATIAPAGQSNFANQEGLTVNASYDFAGFFATATWRFSATVPTAYLLTFRFDGTPTNGTIFYGGLDGANGGWYLEAHSTNGIRAAIGSGSGYVNTSYVGGTSLYDGEYHTVMLVIDDAGGRAKLYTEFGNTESTGLTISSGDAIITIGPQAAGATWGIPVTYLLSARAENPMFYTNAQSAFDAYELARTTGSHPAAITGLPTTLAELNSVLATVTLTNAYNLSTATPSPLAGSAGPSLAAFTGVMAGGGNGTAPTVGAAPQVKSSFAAQPCVVYDSSHDNLQGANAMPDVAHTGLLLFRAPNGTHPNASRDLLGRNDSLAGSRPWSIRTTGTGSLQLESYDSFSGTLRAASISSTDIMNDGLWRAAIWRRDNAGGTNRIEATIPNTTAGGTSGATTQSPSALTPQGGLGRIYQNPFATEVLQHSQAMFGWGTALASNADITTALNNFRWRYGL